MRLAYSKKKEGDVFTKERPDGTLCP